MNRIIVLVGQLAFPALSAYSHNTTMSAVDVDCADHNLSE
jgi:hypothetical protein